MFQLEGDQPLLGFAVSDVGIIRVGLRLIEISRDPHFGFGDAEIALTGQNEEHEPATDNGAKQEPE